MARSRPEPQLGERRTARNRRGSPSSARCSSARCPIRSRSADPEALHRADRGGKIPTEDEIAAAIKEYVEDVGALREANLSCRTSACRASRS
jgi:hypothetical protein